MWRSHWRDAMTGSETRGEALGARRGEAPCPFLGRETPYLEKESEYSTKEGQKDRRGNRTADVMGATTTIGAMPPHF